MRVLAGVLSALLAAPVPAQVVVEPRPFPVAPGLSPSLGALEGLATQLPLAPLETLPALSPLSHTFDGLRPLTSAPEPEGKTPPPQQRPIPEARTISFNGTELLAYLFSFRTKPSVEIKKALDAAQEEMWIAVHGLSIKELGEAILAAKKRWKKGNGPIRVIVNADHMFPGDRKRSPELDKLVAANEPGLLEVRVLEGTGPYGSMHNKIALLDRKVAEFGSFNWSNSADQLHHENVNFTDEQEVVELYRSYYAWMWSLATPVERYRPGQDPAVPTTPPPADPKPNVEYAGERFPRAMFSPNGGIEARLARAVELSDVAVKVAMFAFFSRTIAERLEAKREAGADVRLVIDKSQGRRSPEVRWMLEKGIKIRWSSGHSGRTGEDAAPIPSVSPEGMAVGVMHNKFGVFRSSRGSMAERGSYNWTGNAERHNYENANFSNRADDVEAYDAYFEKLWDEGQEARLDDFAPEAFQPMGVLP